MGSTDWRFDPTPRESEIRDLSPGVFRLILALLLGVGILAMSGVL